MPYDGNGPLLRRPRPQRGEGIMSLLMRVAEANGCDSPYWLLNALGCPSAALRWHAPLANLSAALAIDTDVIEAMRFGPPPHDRKSSYVHCGHGTVHKSAIDVARGRFCPLCLEEAGFVHLGWSLKPVTACPKHKARLVERCPTCRKPITWLRPHLMLCRCGQDLRSIVPDMAEPASTALSNTLLRKVGGQEGLLTGDIDTSAPFADMELRDLADHAMFLGTYASGRGRGTGRHLMPNLVGEAGAEVFRRVAEMMSDWPRGFFALLDEVRRHSSDGTTRSGLEAEFGTFYIALYQRRMRAAPKIHVVQDAFEAYLHDHWDGGFIGPKNKRINASNTGDARRRLVSLAEASRLLDLHPKILERDIAAGILPAVARPMNSRMLYLVDRNELERYRLERNDLVGMPEARRMLGLAKRSFLDLVNAEVVKAVRGPKVDGTAHWTFRRRELMQLVDTMLRDAPASSPGTDHVRYDMALRAGTYRGLSSADFIKAVLAQRLPVACADPQRVGIGRCCFDRQDLLNFLSGDRASMKWGLSVEQAADRLGIKGEVAYHLIRTSLLRSVAITENVKMRAVVPHDAVEDFATSYISAADLAVQYRTSSKHLCLVLRERGVEPVSGPVIDGGRQYFFSRVRLDKQDARAAFALLGRHVEGQA